MKKVAFLDYTFLFDPAKTWQHLYEFEASLSKYFKDMGMEAEIMLPIGGQEGKRILYIRSKETVEIDVKNPVGRPKTLGGRMRDLKEKKVTAKARDFGKRVIRGFDRVKKKASR